jgi:hypothetical protein
MSLIDRLEPTKKFWALMLPDCEMQSDAEMIQWWLSIYSQDEIEYAIARTAGKFRRQRRAPEVVWRYVSGVLKNARRNNGLKDLKDMADDPTVIAWREASESLEAWKETLSSIGVRGSDDDIDGAYDNAKANVEHWTAESVRLGKLVDAARKNGDQP